MDENLESASENISDSARTTILESYYQSSIDGILLVDNQGKIISYNSRFIKIWGMPKDIIDSSNNEDAILFAMNQVLNKDQFLKSIKSFYDTDTKISKDTIELENGKILERYGSPIARENKTLFAWAWRFKDITQKVQQEKAIKESEERFRTMANNISQFAWMADESGWIFWYNQRWYDYTGTTLKEMEGWGWSKVHHPDHLENVVLKFQKAITTGQPWEDTFPLLGKDGNYRWFLSRALPIKDEDGNIKNWFGTNTDITEQRLAEMSLKTIKEQLELTFSNVPCSIYHFDKDGKILFLNNIAAHQMGYKNVQDVLNEKDLFHFRKRLDETFEVLDENNNPLSPEASSAGISIKKGIKSEVISHFINRKTKESFWLLSKSAPLFNEIGELELILTTSTDITLQKTSEKSIRQSEEQFRTLAETLPQLVWITDGEGKQLYASSRWKEYTGIEPTGTDTWQNIVYPDDMEKIGLEWTKSMTTGTLYKTEARLKSKEGDYRWHFVQGEPIKNENGDIIKWIGAFTDIHDKKINEEKLEILVKERTEELKRSNEDLQQFAHVTSHDLKEPVRKIKTFLNMFLIEFDEQISDQAKSYLSKINDSADRLKTMIEGVLTYSSLNGMTQLSEQINLNEVIKTVEYDLELLINQKNATIAADKLPEIEGAFVLIYQLFYNLINNSLKFSKTNLDPKIIIRSEIKRDGLEELVEITFIDNGIGFEPEFSQNIFNNFVRLHSKSEYDGTGLGLTLCKKIVERHGGSITATGMKNIGATFKIVLPTTNKKQL